jgi:pilus assembly protein CpaE
MESVARIVLGVDDHDVAEEVMHFLDRTGNARVVATASDERQLSEAVRQLEPDAVIASPRLVGPQTLNGSALLAVDTRETVGGLRAAIRAGAEGFFLWPADRDELAGAATEVRSPATDEQETAGAAVLAVYGPRGGVGATFVATHLAAAFARRSHSCALVDMDPLFGDVAAAIGVPPGAGTRTIGDLAAVVDELSPERLGDVMWRHEEGFETLLAPDVEDTALIGASAYQASVRALATSHEVVVLHLPRSLGEIARVGADAADRVLLVLTLDVMSFRDAKRALGTLERVGFEGRCDFVVNRASRGEITPRDVERTFGCTPLAVIPADGGVQAAQDRGKLLPRRGRTARALDRLAAQLLEDRP